MCNNIGLIAKFMLQVKNLNVLIRPRQHVSASINHNATMIIDGISEGKEVAGEEHDTNTVVSQGPSAESLTVDKSNTASDFSKRLLIESATLADAGTYSCVTTNEFGEDSSTSEVVVYSKFGVPVLYIGGTRPLVNLLQF